MTPLGSHPISLVMQYIGRPYVSCIKHKYADNSSTLEDCCKASLEEENCLITVMRYIELNPARTNMVEL